jgi:hypothetical protein
MIQTHGMPLRICFKHYKNFEVGIYIKFLSILDYILAYTDVFISFTRQVILYSWIDSFLLGYQMQCTLNSSMKLSLMKEMLDMGAV